MVFGSERQNALGDFMGATRGGRIRASPSLDRAFEDLLQAGDGKVGEFPPTVVPTGSRRLPFPPDPGPSERRLAQIDCGTQAVYGPRAVPLVSGFRRCPTAHPRYPRQLRQPFQSLPVVVLAIRLATAALFYRVTDRSPQPWTA